jgi:hypothetical protein
VEVSDALPGADLIRKGLTDLASGVESIESLLVLVGAPRLRRLGFDVPDDTPFLPEDRLYAKLADEGSGSAHSRYNALIRRLVSFERAGECLQENVTEPRIRAFMRDIGERSSDPGRIYLTGGASAILMGWRESTAAIDISIAPVSDRILRAIPNVKERLHINIELSSPADFVPALPGWETRSPFIALEGPISFHHYDFYTQALSKLERSHRKDLLDVASMIRDGLVDPERLRALFEEVAESLYRYPAIDPPSLRAAVERLPRL